MATYALEWKDPGSTEAQINEREFVINGGKKPVPGILWTPDTVERPLPLVLFGHQGSAHKRVSEALMLAHRFAGGYQFAFAAIDGPVHGGREVPGDYAAAMAEGGVENVIDGMVEDWTATQEQLTALDHIDGNQVAYIGFSMGTRFGLPYTAAAGDGLRCSVLGKNGLQSNDEALARGQRRPSVHQGRAKYPNTGLVSHAVGRPALPEGNPMRFVRPDRFRRQEANFLSGSALQGNPGGS